MTLKRQLIVLGLCTAVLPWLVIVFVGRLDDALRERRAESVSEQAESLMGMMLADNNIVSLLRDRASLTPAKSLITLPANRVFDGYLPEWGQPELRGYGFGVSSGPVSAQVFFGQTERHLRLAFTLAGMATQYYSPQQKPFDYFVADFARAGRFRLSSTATGIARVERWQNGQWQRDYATSALWMENQRGSTVEWNFPVTFREQRVTLEYFQAALGYSEFLTPNNIPFYLAYSTPDTLAPLDPALADDQKLWLFDARGELVDTSGSLSIGDYLPATRLDSSWWRLLYDGLIGRPGDAYVMPREVASSAPPVWLRESRAPVVRVTLALKGDSGAALGWLVVDRQQVRFETALAKLFGQVLIVSLVFVGALLLMLLGFATLHSWRIRRLATQADGVVDEQGGLRLNDVAQHFHQSHFPDEIGQVSRSFYRVLQRLEAHQDYLKNLAGKLSHELRTPIAIVQSSLDNITALPEDQRIYMQRARDGIYRLSTTLSAMSTVNQIEATLTHSEKESIYIAPLLIDLCGAYRDVYAEANILYDGQIPEGCKACLAPELFVQMVDKLVENAVQFARPGTEIRVCTDLTGDPELPTHLRLSVSNIGPPIPEAIQHQVFDSMVSSRGQSPDGTVHLGLGLYVARLICRFHNGTITVHCDATVAHDHDQRPDDIDTIARVTFDLRIPLDLPKS